MTAMFSIFTLAIKFDYSFFTIFQSFHLFVGFIFDKLAPPLNICFKRCFKSLFSPLQCIKQLEASHANAYARAIAFFSYTWFKYDILSLQCCKVGGLVVSTLSFRPSAPGFDSWMGCANCDTVCRNLEEYVHSYVFFASKPCITVRVKAAMPA